MNLQLLEYNILDYFLVLIHQLDIMVLIIMIQDLNFILVQPMIILRSILIQSLQIGLLVLLGIIILF